MVECNVYSGCRGKLVYQFTETYESLVDAELDAQEIAEKDALEYGYTLAQCEWMAVPTEDDDIELCDLVGSKYL